MVDNYILALLYGDGCFQVKEEKYEWFMFTTTHKEIADKIRNVLTEKKIQFFSYTRDRESKDWELLEIIEITDIRFLTYLKEKRFKDGLKLMDIDGNFMRGYLETKGTLFQYLSKGNVAWRISFSGTFDDLTTIKFILEKLGIKSSSIIVRKEREKVGIISNSYRMSIHNRKGIAKFLEYTHGIEVSEYLKQRIEGFTHFHKTKPFNVKKNYKHYKYAVQYMARELNIIIKGIAGGGGLKIKPVFLFNDKGNPILEFAGWGGAYAWISKKYQEETGFIPPSVKITEEIKNQEGE